MTVLTRRMPTRPAALLAVALLMLVALAVALAYGSSIRTPVAANGVIQGNGVHAPSGVTSGFAPDANGVIHGD